jgi:uncharacterized hydrophobic protein (TIGR00271 family)
MLHLRVFGDFGAMAEVAEQLETLTGVRHVSRTDAGHDGTALVTADVSAETADAALEVLARLSVPAEDIALVRLDLIAPLSTNTEPLALVWADLLGQARVNARTAVRYLVFMAVAGVIAAFGVIDDNLILIVGAMAVSPDLLPITAACTGIVLRRGRLLRRGLVSLAVGLGVAGVTAFAVTGMLNLFGGLPNGFSAQAQNIVSTTHVNSETILVALAAGIAGMLALETRASAAVGVAISVTTIPASAFLGVAAGVGELSKSLSALGVLGANVSMMLVSGSLTLAVQRALAPNDSTTSSPPPARRGNVQAASASENTPGSSDPPPVR